jgi:hypothetical protein
LGADSQARNSSDLIYGWHGSPAVGGFTVLPGEDLFQVVFAHAQDNKGRRKAQKEEHLLDVTRRFDGRGWPTLNKSELVDAI